MHHPSSSKHILRVLTAFTSVSGSLFSAQIRPDVVIADFEDSYTPWTMTGAAFAPGPQAPKSLYTNRHGQKLAVSREEFSGDSAQGTLTSPSFTIERYALNFLLGGGNYPDETCVELLIAGKVVKSTPGLSSKQLAPIFWDLREYQGQTASIRIADRKQGKWGHIAADNFVLTDRLDTIPEPVASKPDDGTKDIVFADFENGTYAPWTVTDGAFGQAPARPGTGLDSVTGYQGTGIASSKNSAKLTAWESRIGTLLSPEFTVSRAYLNFLIGGGNHAFRAAVSLWIDGRIVRTSAGNGSDHLEWATWDLRDLQGKRAQIGIYDNCIEDKPGYVLVDQITFSDYPRANIGGDVNQAIVQVRSEAVQAIRRNTPLAASDPWRPIYHYAPPAQRMNDPNGPVWYNGYHHVFYQHMVFTASGQARDVHWGHARSRDLVNWETLPLAIPPAYELGELSVFSGNMARDKQNNPVQFTTMVPYKAGVYRRVWAARPIDEDWIRWEKTPETPDGLVPHTNLNRNIKDPFPFSAGDRRFMVLVDHDIPIFEATNDDLTGWVYRGVLDAKSAECPNFFEVDGHWIYLSSPNTPVHYAVGDFNPETAAFTPQTEGQINHENGFYASTAYRDDQGRTILLGITRGQPAGRGWTGALALPRILTIGSDLRPRMNPVPELQSLRREAYSISQSINLNSSAQVLNGLKGDAMEIIARFKAGTAQAFGVRVRRSDDRTRNLPVMWSNGHIIVVKENPKYPCRYEIYPETKEIEFHIFLDKGILDACTGDGKVFESRIHSAPVDDMGVEVFAEGGSATLLSFEAWKMAPAKIDHSLLLDSETNNN